MKNKNTLTCSHCGKWLEEENLMITSQGAKCEDCYIETKNE